MQRIYFALGPKLVWAGPVHVHTLKSPNPPKHGAPTFSFSFSFFC